jgi:hypothetical protein
LQHRTVATRKNRQGVELPGGTEASLIGPPQAMKKNLMTCREFVGSLKAFRDEELTSQDLVRAQKHPVDCDQCSTYFHGHERIIDLKKL